mmetsp:Transcript_25734/g.83125  ORF Transcript_25734/g.83125 Transcript_25734/m.83125 type:complete len:116 (-) Transcript_25734:214-561(-)
MDDSILHGSGGAKDPTTKSTLTDAPVLQSLAANRAARLEYRVLLIGWANEMGYGSIYRNEVPAVLRKSLPIDIDTELPIITDDMECRATDANNALTRDAKLNGSIGKGVCTLTRS